MLMRHICTAALLTLTCSAGELGAQEIFTSRFYASNRVKVSSAYVGQNGQKVFEIEKVGIGLLANASISAGSGVTATITSTTADQGRITVRISATSSASTGSRTATIRYPWGTLTFPLRVLRGGTLTSVTPSANVAINTPVTFTISGTGLDVAAIVKAKTDLANITVVSRTATSLRIRGTPSGCGTNRIVIGDQAFGGDEFQYSPGGLDLQLNIACGYRAAPAPSVYCATGYTYNASTGTCIKP
jgi:hypothetical protein